MALFLLFKLILREIHILVSTNQNAYTVFETLNALGLELSCSGEGWTLTLGTETASFTFPAPTEMDVPLVTKAKGADWPRAYSLIGERDTAIVVVERERCGADPYRAHVLTQRGQTPILLTGCCQAEE